MNAPIHAIASWFKANNYLVGLRLVVLQLLRVLAVFGRFTPIRLTNEDLKCARAGSPYLGQQRTPFAEPLLIAASVRGQKRIVELRVPCSEPLRKLTGDPKGAQVGSLTSALWP